MSQRDKLFASIRNNPRDVRFDDACLAAEWIGFARKGGSGSHNVYARPGEPMELNFQKCNSKIKPYQAKQLVGMISKYREEIS